MSRLLLRWIVLALSVVISGYVTSTLGLSFEAKVDSVQDFLGLMVGTAVLAFLNATLGRLLKILTIPLNCLTLGLFSLVINALVLMLTAQLGLGFALTGSSTANFLSAFVASLLISFVSGVLGTFIPDSSDE